MPKRLVDDLGPERLDQERLGCVKVGYENADVVQATDGFLWHSRFSFQCLAVTFQTPAGTQKWLRRIVRAGWRPRTGRRRSMPVIKRS